ncbi:inositol monophosphatase family protein [Streptomyces chiangmaiensis]
MTWYVDPIDGTSNFAGGVPFFCVSIGAALHDRLIAGVVYDPLREELFTAHLGGAAVNGVPMSSRGVPTDRTAVLATDFPTHRESGLAANGLPDAELFAEMVRSFRTVRRLGSGALTLAYVAAGRLDATVGLNAKPWDVAAGAMLVEAAGGVYRPVRRDAGSAPGPWAASSYVACVADFDLSGSCLAQLVGGSDD